MRYMYTYTGMREAKRHVDVTSGCSMIILIYLSLYNNIRLYILRAVLRTVTRYVNTFSLVRCLFRFVRHCTLHCSTRITQPCSMTGDNDPSLSLTLWGTALWMAEECSRLFSFATQRDILREDNRSFFRILSIFLNASSILLTVNYNWIIL